MKTFCSDFQIPRIIIENFHPRINSITTRDLAATRSSSSMCIANSTIGSRRAFRPLDGVDLKPVARESRVDHIIVTHDYHDHSSDDCSSYQQEQHPARGGVTTPFPLKLHEMLDSVQADGREGIVSWQPHGRCFIVHKPKEFVDLLPRYFKISKLASFQRQLNLYGFQRLTRGKDRGGYYHELFLRNRIFLAHNIQRIKVKGTKVRARSNPEQEPDFWTMPWIASDGDRSRALKQYPEHVKSNEIPTSDDSDDTSTDEEENINFTSPLPMQPRLPASVLVPALETEQDVVCTFENMKFHYLETPLVEKEDCVCLFENKPFHCMDIDEILPSEAASFFKDFEFPVNIGDNIEDDFVFQNILQSLVAA